MKEDNMDNTFSWERVYIERVVNAIGDSVQPYYHANGISSKDLLFIISLSLSSSTFYKYFYAFEKYITRDSGLWNLTEEGTNLYESMKIEQKALKVSRLLKSYSYSQLATNKQLYHKQREIVDNLEAQLDSARSKLYKLEEITFPIG